ncbi:MAG: polyamine ABC transporter substrate-binding protein [Actinomycetota bacterium]
MGRSRILRSLGVLFVLALVAAACGSDGDGGSVPLEDQTLVFANFGAYTPEGFLEEFTAATGAEVTLTEFTNNEDILGRLQASGGSGFDVVMISGPYVQTLIDNGWLAELDHEQIPNLENLYPEATQLGYDVGNVYSVPYSWGTTGLCYRTDLVDTEIDSWQDLLSPAAELDGKITMLGTERWLLQPALLSLGYSINTQDEAEIEEAKDLTLQAKEHLLAFDDTIFYERLDAGEAALVHAWDGWCNYATNENVEFVVPSEGSDVFADTMVIMASSENQEAAHAFINFVLEPENHVKVAELVLYKVPNAPAMDLLDPALVEAYPNLGITPEELLEFETELDLGEAQSTWTQAATEIKA